MRPVKKMENIPLITLGNRIEDERTKIGMTQQELADKLSIKRQKLSYIEKNIEGRNLTIQELEQIANIFNVSTDYLLGRTSSKEIDNIEISKILGLNDKAIEMFMDIKENKRSKLFNDLINVMFLGNNLDSILRNIAEYSNINGLLDSIKKINKTIKLIYPEKDFTEEEIKNLQNYWNSCEEIRNSYKLPTLDTMKIDTEIKTIQDMITSFCTEKVVNGILALNNLETKLENVMSLLVSNTNEILLKSTKDLTEKHNTYYCEDYFHQIIEGD